MNLKEIEALYDIGLAIHWLRPKSKIPLKSGWTTGERQEWRSLLKSHKPGLNAGVRLGKASQLDDGTYLAVIDLDVKSGNPVDAEDARKKLFELFPEARKAPYLKSGRGNGSSHYYVRVKEPTEENELKARSEKIVPVYMPSVSPNSKEKERFTEKELQKGLRLRPAWEISLLCEGRQAAIVGSIHPDTEKKYKWGKPIDEIGSNIPLLKNMPKGIAGQTKKRSTVDQVEMKIDSFVEVDVEELNLREDQIAAIREGTGVNDRSAKVYELCMALLARKVSEKKIISLFTDTRFYLGQMAYSHARTSDRRRAASWLHKYCLTPAKAKVNETPFDIEELPTDENQRAQWRKEKHPTGENKRETLGCVGLEQVVGGWQCQIEKKYRGKNKPSVAKPTYGNIKLILSNMCETPRFLAFDEFTHRTFFTCDTPWGAKKNQERSAGTEDALRVKKWLHETYEMEPSLSLIDECLNTCADQNKVHPVKEYLESLHWDGMPRMSTAFKTYLGAEMPEPYLTEVTKKFFLACIKRIYEPGCKFDHMVVLEGKQGLGKSTFSSILAGEKWFIDQLPPLHDKDAALNLVGVWICEVGELAAIYKSANESTKAFISRRVDKVRPPYGQRRVEYFRTVVFLGTTDKSDYLSDSAGNRRYWPVKVKQCDFDALEWDRDQLWAEAKAEYDFSRRKLKLYLEGEAKEQAAIIQESRRAEDEGDSMKILLERWLKENKSTKEFTMHDLFNGPWLVLPHSRHNTMRAGEVLRKMGYEKKHTKKGNKWFKSGSPGVHL